MDQENSPVATVEAEPKVAPVVPDQNVTETARLYLADLRNREWMEFKIGNDSNVKKTANAICWHIRQGRKIYLSAIGAGAVNQAIKSATIASSKLRAEGQSLSIIPGFYRQEKPVAEGEDVDVLEEKVNDDKTVMRMFLKVDVGI
jgi:stage V sporulation protein S